MSEIIDGPGVAWEECEKALDANHASLPLYHRVAWARAGKLTGARFSFVPVRDAGGACRAGFAFESHPSRALPGHRLIAIHRLGIGSGGLDESSLVAGLKAMTGHIRRERSVLRVTVELFALNADARDRTAEILRDCGFVRVPAERIYERTLVLDLSPTEDMLLAGFHKNARQGIRNVARYPVEVTSAAGLDLAPRLQQLSDETRDRTGGELRPFDWPSLIRLSNDASHLSRIAILRRTDVAGPEGVLAFAWGCMHGDMAEYSESGSTRAHELKVSTSYALLWDLMQWSRANGAKWFDLGGVSDGRTHSDDPLGGISDFKRRFSQRELEVGQQWELEPSPMRAAAARAVSGAVALMRKGARRLRGGA